MPFDDKTLICQDCNKEFVWSAGEQEFFAQKGFQNVPKRCPDCRKQRRKEGPKTVSTDSDKSFEIVCAKCGKKDSINFEPRRPETILCEECFKTSHASEDGKNEQKTTTQESS